MVHPITYDPALPISQWHDEIAQTIAEHQVVVIAGETGSGKTTQLPKICLELGRRSIGHTQPRRIAARSVAERVAEELRSPLGEVVGYQVRFTRKASAQTRLKIMTDGVLLAEISHDRDLRRYDTIIIDEAHERSLNIDFLLGYLKLLAARRPDLKIIVTSATIDTDRFAAHFADVDGVSAPIIEVSGRTYPVEIRYRPILADGEADQVGGICAAITELSALGDGDILVFCSGEREIRDAADAITAMDLRRTEVLPLYARLSAAEQHRVFTSHAGRRIVLATNVAETSLTVPGIRYVVDPGTARMSRYSARTKVQRLPIEPISRASANQRAGRCGRVAPGVCIRLYDEEDFESRPEFTEPEILRTNLASVILQMTAADLGAIATFPFVEAPDASQINDGLRLLIELGALSSGLGERPRLTGIGRRLARIPVDPRMGRMLLAGERLGCLAEIMIIVAGLSIQDPRERPAEDRDKAEALHRRFWAPLPGADADAEAEAPEPDGSDFQAYLRLWDYLRSQQKTLSGNAFRRMCRQEHLHFLRIREWQDLHAQLRDIARDLKLDRNTAPAPIERVHTAILTGLLSQIGLADLKDEKPGPGTRRRGRPPLREYLGARGTRFAINPGSALAKTQPPLVMAGEIVETTRLWARTVAPITAAQVEEVGGHLIKRTYAEPHWSTRQAAVLAYETVSLFGVPIVAGRRVAYGGVNSGESRDIFLRSALVEGRWHTRHRFFEDNQRLRAEAAELEERTRRRDLVVDDQVIYDFYDARVPAEVTSGAHFDRWWKTTRHEQPDLLTMTMDDLVVADPTGSGSAFPDHWRVDDHDLTVGYRFSPGDPRDGVSVTIPLAVLNQVDEVPFSWQVPGMRTELATELIRALPKAVRKTFVPAPEYASRALRWLADHPAPDGTRESLPQALARALRGLTGERVEPGDIDLAKVSPHLRVTFVITDAPTTGDSGEVAVGKDLTELAEQLAPKVQQTLTKAAARHSQTGATDWVFGTITPTVELTRAGHRVVGYPALVDEGSSVGLLVTESADRQQATHRRGLRRLVQLQTPDPTKWVISHLANTDKLSLGTSPYASVPALLADVRLASVGELIRRAGGEQTRNEQDFRRLCDTVRVDNADQMRAITHVVARTLALRQQVLRLVPSAGRLSRAAAEDVSEQVGNLVFAGFVAATAYEHLTELPRYLTAAEQRLTALASSPTRDQRGAEVIGRCEDAYAAACDLAPPGPLPAELDEIGWLLEELRVGLFAQNLRTKVPASEKRVMTAIAAARQRLGG
ncbi:MAG TPA: ATP-dependent RNA helicase HrpA [Microlunatus sp.]|nr:ATP-dependent RNA helicase HrpA [Microlunatus sp.]